MSLKVLGARMSPDSQNSRAEVRLSFITTTVWEESHHKGATGRVGTGDQLLPVLCHCHLGQDIPKTFITHQQ